MKKYSNKLKLTLANLDGYKKPFLIITVTERDMGRTFTEDVMVSVDKKTIDKMIKGLEKVKGKL